MKLKERIKKLLKIDNDCRWYFAIKYKVGSIPYYLFRVFPIQKKKIVFVSFKGKYGGDPKYISDMMHQTDPTMDLVWLIKNASDCKDSFVRIVPYGSVKAIYEMVTAKVWVDDGRKEGVVRKRRNQFYIGTGHGGIPMKKIEKDAQDKLEAVYLMLAENDSRMTDLKPSNSQWRNDMLKRAFWYDGEILNCGLPRVEYLIKNHKKLYSDIRERYGLAQNIKVFLYAPTFRKNGDTSVYDIDFQRVKVALENRFGGQWIGFRRLHPTVANIERINSPGTVIDTTDYPDMEDLIMASNSLITDYSSCIFETLFLDIPAFIYAKDMDEYIKEERGLYWSIDELPFMKATSNDELISGIQNYDPTHYQDGMEALKHSIGFFEDQTHATESLVQRIIEEQKN